MLLVPARSTLSRPHHGGDTRDRQRALAAECYKRSHPSMWVRLSASMHGSEERKVGKRKLRRLSLPHRVRRPFMQVSAYT